MPSDSRQNYMDLAVKRYSSLFRLPSHRRIIFFLAILCFLGSFVALIPFTHAYFAVALGAGFFFITILSDFIVYGLIRLEPIYNMRRCNALSLFSNSVWFVLMFVGTVLGLYFQDTNVWWLKLFLLGFCATSLLRLLVYSATLFQGHVVVLVSTFLQPVFWVLFLFLTWSPMFGSLPEPSFLIFPLISIPLVVVTVSLFIYSVNHVGKKTLGVPSMPLLKAFLANWVADINVHLEKILESIGIEQQVEISLLVFETEKKVKAAMVVPSFHPGPFKNVGSSFLPYLIQSKLENQLNCIVAVPHGLFGHEFDLASQAQNQKVLDAILNSFKFDNSDNKASPFIRSKKGIANASCQIFGEDAVLALTIAPETTEDFPKELGFLAMDEAKKNGLASAILINAHNSINGPFNLEKALPSLKEAIVESLAKATRTKRSMLKIGAAKVVPNEFSLEDGMGPGGISAIITQVGKQTAAYITIDGNNLVSGLREKILNELKAVGIDEGEILTTDTHGVSAVVLNKRGYHPVGEVMDQERLIGYVKHVASEALKNLEAAKVSCKTITVSNAKVIGEQQIEGLCALTEKSTSQAKKSALIFFSIATVMLIALLLLMKF